MKGFTLIELLIVLAIIAILAGIAVPAYQSYATKSYYTEIIQASAPFALGVNNCYQIKGALASCSGGANGVPSNLTTATGGVGSVVVVSGVITVTPVAQHGILAADTYVLSPTPSGNTLTWQVSGGCISKSYC